MIDSYESYVKHCVEENATKLNSHNAIIKYYRDSNGHPHGVILAFSEGDKVYIGTSLCNRNEKRGFNKHIGINKALHNSVPLKNLATPLSARKNIFTTNVRWGTIPDSMLKQTKEVVKRAFKYFKESHRPLVTTNVINLPEKKNNADIIHRMLS